MLLRLIRYGVVFASCAFLNCASAVAVTITDEDPNILPTLPASDSYPYSFINPGTTFDHVVTGGGVPVGSNFRSPFQNVDQSYPLGGYDTAPYSSVRNGSVGYNFNSGKSGLSILWGSPDTYNTLQFWSGLNGTGTLLGSFTGSSLLEASPLQLGHDYVTFFSDVLFLSVVLSSTSPAFEYAVLSTTGPNNEGNLPLPPALILFGSALVGLVTLGRRRRQEAAA